MGDKGLDKDLDVVLVNPPFSLEDLTGKTKSMKGVMNVIPPLGLCYVAAVLEQNDFHVEIIDGQLGISHEELLRKIEEKKPDILGIGSTTPTFGSAIKVAGGGKISAS